MKNKFTFTSKKQKRNLTIRYVIAIVLATAAIITSQLPRRAEIPDNIHYAQTLAEPLEGGLALNSYAELSVPTQITKIGDDYFLVDCYHNQILTSPSLEAPLTEWLVLTDQINRGHTIAGDGIVYLADDTEDDRVLVFEKRDGHFYQTQVFDEIGTRPHYIVYDGQTERFYALSSMTGEMYLFYRPDPDSPAVALEKVLSIPDLDGAYVRSFSIDGNDIYFVSSDSRIICANKYDLQALIAWDVPEEIAGMVQLTRIQNYYYITVSTNLAGNQDYATLLRTQNLVSLYNHDWEDIYSEFIGGGTPYYISSFDGHYYLTEHRIPGHGVWQFDVENDEITNVKTLFP